MSEDRNPPPSSTQSKNKGGRPKDENLVALPQDELDRLLVHGETRPDHKGKPRRYYPSFNALADRFGVSRDRIKRFAQKERCLDRRQEATRARRERNERHEQIRHAQHVSDEHRAREEKKRFSRTVVNYLDAFGQLLKKGKIDATKPLDFIRMTQLYLSLQEHLQSDSASTEGDNDLTLESLQDEHAEMLERLRESQKKAPPGQRYDPEDDVL